MKFTTGLMIMILSAAAFAIGFAVRCVLASSSRNNIASFARATRERSASMKHAVILDADYRLGNILSTRKIMRPFSAQIPETADQAELNVMKCFYKLVFSMLANGK